MRERLKDAAIAANAAKDAANAAAESNKINRESSAAELRPWISCKVVATGPLTYSERGVFLDFDLVMHNFGRAKFYSFDGGEDVKSKFREWCEMLKFSVNHFGQGTSLFPGETRIQMDRQGFNKEELDKALMDIGSGRVSFSPLIFVCISYQPHTFSATHQTGITLSLHKVAIRNGEQRHVMQNVNDGNVPLNQIRLDEFVAGGHFAS